MQLEICADRQLLVEREALRHVADAQARREVARPRRPSEQFGAPVADAQQAGEHLHRRRLAAAVRAEKAEDLAAPDAEADVIDGVEIAEPARQPLRDDRRRAVCARRQRRDATPQPRRCRRCSAI